MRAFTSGTDLIAGRYDEEFRAVTDVFRTQIARTDGGAAVAVYLRGGLVPLVLIRPVAGRATVPNFLPLLAERFARQRLIALARVDGKITDAKPIVLFVCTHNAGRSQMALGFFTHLAGDRAVAWSDGSDPANEINPAAVAVMSEVGVDITAEFPKPWTEEIVEASDIVITMGCGDACPVFPGHRYQEWLLPDPAGQSVDAVRPIRDDIEQRVPRLLSELNITPTNEPESR